MQTTDRLQMMPKPFRGAIAALLLLALPSMGLASPLPIDLPFGNPQQKSPESEEEPGAGNQPALAEQETITDEEIEAYEIVPPVPEEGEEVIDLSGTVHVVDLERTITPAVADLINENIEHAVEEKAQLLLLRLDTPGGLLQATRDIVKSLLASPIPVAVYVSPKGARSGSAGVFITMASHVAAMAPGTNIGAAHPVNSSGEDIKGEMARKVTNDAAAWVESVAKERGRNALWAIKSVRESDSIPEDRALEIGAIEHIADNVEDLLQQADGRVVKVETGWVRLHTAEAEVVQIEMSLRQKILAALSNPNLVYILLLLGMLGIVIEIQSPGLIIPGVSGALCILLALGASSLPINWLAFILILCAGALFVMEVYITSFGLLTVGGVVCLAVGSYLLFDVEGVEVRVDTDVIVTTIALFLITFFFCGYFVLKAMRQGQTTGSEGMIGQIGETFTELNPKGTVWLHGEYWRARLADGAADTPKGADVRVVELEGSIAIVEPVNPAEPEAG